MPPILDTSNMYENVPFFQHCSRIMASMMALFLHVIFLLSYGACHTRIQITFSAPLKIWVCCMIGDPFQSHPSVDTVYSSVLLNFESWNNALNEMQKRIKYLHIFAKRVNLRWPMHTLECEASYICNFKTKPWNQVLHKCGWIRYLG